MHQNFISANIWVYCMYSISEWYNKQLANINKLLMAKVLILFIMFLEKPVQCEKGYYRPLSEASESCVLTDICLSSPF